MKVLLVIGGIILYAFIGMVIGTAVDTVQGSNGGNAIWAIAFWPILSLGLIVIWIMNLAFNIGEGAGNMIIERNRKKTIAKLASRKEDE